MTINILTDCLVSHSNKKKNIDQRNLELEMPLEMCFYQREN